MITRGSAVPADSADARFYRFGSQLFSMRQTMV